jgi:hypothetical protein
MSSQPGGGTRKGEVANARSVEAEKVMSLVSLQRGESPVPENKYKQGMYVNRASKNNASN